MDWSLVLPELVIAGTGMACLLVDLFLAPAPGQARRRSRRAVGYLAVVGLLGAGAAAVALLTRALAGSMTAPALPAYVAGMVAVDPLAVILKILFVAVGVVVALLGVDYAETHDLPVGEFFALLCFSVLGMTLMAATRDLLMIYLGLEATSISSYALAGLLRKDPKSGEAAIKYMLTGALASAVVLFGMALVFGATGTTNLSALLSSAVGSPVAITGLVLLIAGFGFKVAAVPFHFWAPDAYEGAPTPVTAFFSVGPKAASFAALLRIFGAPLLLFGPIGGGGLLGGTAGSGAVLQVLFTVLAVVTMTVGNLTALAQKNIKRMLAYSSIAHAGYLLVGLAVATPGGFGAVVYYLLAYAAMNLGAFAVVIWLNNRGTGDDIADYAGLGRRAPWAGLALVLCFLSLIGIPPTAGFFGKFYLFLAAVGGGMTWLAVVMVINSAISVGYYYGVVRQMYLVRPETQSAESGHGAVEAQGTAAASAAGQPGTAATGEAAGTPVRGTPLVSLALGLAVAAVLIMGLLFEPLLRATLTAGMGL